ncbi:hypothetical protein FFONT_0185 [Fervidicoccus fontis Kam940]|uniref:Uncharacterized protein n=1 Tax=Fervidicoccus fontis (strain DSM 19380 / JCM 18336 / VKM B-2539 / Kam940) TaxID=1163730 RepID=H9ZZL9_FERFK|nr:hypothetical protein FFONT_0185 [Fervidicoccus fontis Kam940]
MIKTFIPFFLSTRVLRRAISKRKLKKARRVGVQFLLNFSEKHREPDKKELI